MKVESERKVTVEEVARRLERPTFTSFACVEATKESFSTMCVVSVKMEIPKFCVHVLEGLSKNCGLSADELAGEMLCDTIWDSYVRQETGRDN